MQLPRNAYVAVVDGETLNLYRNQGDEASPKLVSLPHGEVSTDNKGSGIRHASSSANPSDSQQEEDSFAAGSAEILNKQALAGKFDALVVIAAPRTLGELRKHYHKTLSSKLVGELDKDLTGHPPAEIEKAILAA